MIDTIMIDTIMIDTIMIDTIMIYVDHKLFYRSWRDLNPRPKVYKTFALTRLSYMTDGSNFS
jgi:hypothetical protein